MCLPSSLLIMFNYVWLFYVDGVIPHILQGLDSFTKIIFIKFIPVNVLSLVCYHL